MSSLHERRGPSPALLDVNVLIALLDPCHVHHELADGWFAQQGERLWASCPITQNAVLRILGHRRYPNSPGSPGVVSEVLLRLVAHPRHRFWEAAPSLLDQLPVRPGALLDPGQITDTYLLALAVHHRGVLVSLDQRLITQAVRGGEDALERIPA